MRKILLFVLIAVMLATTLSTVAYSNTNAANDNGSKEEVKGYIDLDLTDIYKEYGYKSLFDMLDDKECGRPKLQYRLGENVKVALSGWDFTAPNAFRPDLLVYIRNENKPNTSPAFQTLSPSNTLMPFAINQPLPPAGHLDWDWGNSQSPSAPPTGPEWTNTELGYIRNFIEGGGGIGTGMESCVLDVFGAPMFNVKIRIYKDGTGTTLNGAAGLYMGSTGNSNLQGVIWLHPDAGLPPNVVTSKGNFSQEERLEVITHEMIHACYDQLNFINIHPWTEGITECQAVLARKLWFDLNGYNDTFFNNNGAGKYFLSDGVPPVLPTYELNNQPALAAYSRQFYTNNNILQPRLQSMAALRYQYAAAVWWKTWRDTTTGIISPTNSTTFGANSFFVRFNTEYYDYAATNGGVFYIGVPGIRSDVPAINTLVSDTLNVMKGNTFVENQDYTSDWLVKQNVMSANDAWGLNLFAPNGPMTPAGGFGNPDYAGPANRIDDLGPVYLGTHPLGLGTGTYWGVTVSPVLYEVFGSGGSSGERPVVGQASLTITRLQNNTDVTAQVRYHDAYANFGAPPPGGWLPIPATFFNFNGNPLGYITPLAAGGGIWPQLRFDMAGLPATGGYSLTFNGTSGALSCQTLTFYGDGEHAAGQHVGIINGGGTLAGSAISLLNTPPGGPFPARVPFGGDSSFNSSLIPGQPFVEGTVVGYEFREQGISYSDFEYANVGKHYYIHIITTSTNRMDETVGPWEGRIGHAVIAQATNFGGANPSRVYWNQFITEQSPGFINVARGVYRPDYIPQDSELVACYLYANSVGENVGGNFVNQPIYVNGGMVGNPDNDPCFGELLGKCWRIGGDTPGCAAGGWDDQRSFFRFDITAFIDNIYDPIRITNLWQAYEPPPSLGVPYGYQILAIYRNDSLPTNKIMVRDGALLLYQQFGQPYKRVTFNNFRTPLDPANWPVDTANAGAYVTFMGMSADNGGAGACPGIWQGSSQLEWDFWSITTNNEPRGDYFWPNPQPADPQVGQGGSWWALGNLNPASVTLPNGVTNYAFSPRAWRQGTTNVGGGTMAEYAWGAKQAASHWFWDQPFSVFAMKTPLQWRAGTGAGYQNWWDWVNMDWAPNGNPGNLHRPSRSYLYGDDTTLTLVPFTSCITPVDSGPGSDDGILAPCIATPFPNRQCAGAGIGSNAWACQATNLPYSYPRHDERGHLNAVILQVPIVPSLTVEKLCDPNPVLPEGVITYTVIVRNDSPYPNVAPVVQEIYPKGVTFLDSTPAPDMGDNIWNKSIRKAVPLGTPPYSDDEGVLQPFEQFTITIRVRAGKLPKGTLLTNVVNAYSRTSPSVVSAICQVTVLGEPLITITKTTKKFMAQQGEKVEYTLIIQNVGTREATGITVVDMLPRELEYVSSLPSGSAGLQKITWAFGLLNPGQTIRISLTLRIRRDIRLNPGITINNIAVVTTKGGLRDEDAAMIMLRGGPSDVIVCECPDVSINFAGMKNLGGGLYEVAGSGKVKIGMHPYGGCGPYAMSVDFEDDGKIEYSFNIENDSDKEFDYNITSGDYTMVVKSADRYGSTCIYTKKIRVK